MSLTTHRLGTLGMLERWEGIVTAADIISLLSAQDEAGAAPLRYLIVDLRRVIRLEVGSEDVYKMADRLRLRQRQVSERVVAIAPQDLMYGLVRMLGLTLGDDRAWTGHVVRTAAEAIAWLTREIPDLDFTEARDLLNGD